MKLMPSAWKDKGNESYNRGDYAKAEVIISRLYKPKINFHTFFDDRQRKYGSLSLVCIQSHILKIFDTYTIYLQ
jgi:hypothetical protein